MTKEENILFCKIAVHNNFVSAADANAVLREAAAARADVRELFLQRRLLDEAACAKIMRGVAARAGKPVGARPPTRAKAAAEERRAVGAKPERRVVAKPLSNNQMIAAGVGSLVFLLCVFYVVYVLVSGGATTQNQEEAKKPATGVAATTAPGSAAPGTTAPAPGTPAAPPKAEQVSEAYKQTIEKALNEALADGTASITTDTMGPKGLAPLDGWKKEYGKLAAEEQVRRYQEFRDKLVAVIKKKFENDKGAVVAAKQKGETEKVAELRREIAKYADEATLAELESLLK
jgi:hypothetical protein